MVAGGGLGTATAVGSAANISLRLFQIIYEFKAVGQQTQDLLESTNHVSSTLQSAEIMRQQKSAFLTADERDCVDNIIVDTRRCLKSVAALVEPARVDIQIKSGHVGFLNRSRFVFRDSPKVANNLARLGIAHQSLNSAMCVLCSKGPHCQPVSDIYQHQFMSQPSYERERCVQLQRLPRMTSASLSSDDGETLSSAYSHSQRPFFIVQIQSPDPRLSTIDSSPKSSMKTRPETADVSPSTIPKDAETHEGVDFADPRLLTDPEGLEVQAQASGLSRPIEVSSIYRSKGRAWLATRSMQLR